MPDYGLGRRFAPDPEDENYPIHALLAAAGPEKLPDYRYWAGHMFLDQGSTSKCVEFAFHHWVQTGIIRPKGKYPYWVPGEPYHEMQRVDEWPGEDYDGTSVRVGAKVLQSMGYLESYLWAWDLNTVLNAVATVGPLVMGTNWYYDMFDPDNKGIVKVDGPLAGGHAWLIDGVNFKTGMIRAKNSWSRQWGRFGRFWMTFEDLETLIEEDGEACLAVEVKP